MIPKRVFPIWSHDPYWWGSRPAQITARKLLPGLLGISLREDSKRIWAIPFLKLVKQWSCLPYLPRANHALFREKSSICTFDWGLRACWRPRNLLFLVTAGCLGMTFVFGFTGSIISTRIPARLAAFNTRWCPLARIESGKRLKGFAPS